MRLPVFSWIGVFWVQPNRIFTVGMPQASHGITWVTVRETKDVAHYSSYIKNLYNLTDTVKESTCFYNTAASKWNKFLMIISSPDEKKKAGGEFQIGLSDLAENRPSKWRVRKICTCLNITSRCYFQFELYTYFFILIFWYWRCKWLTERSLWLSERPVNFDDWTD